MYMAKTRDVEAPMLGACSAATVSTSSVRRSSCSRGAAAEWDLSGSALKPGTDDLRESPLVTLAETLIGKGLELSIYDPHVNVSVLMGANKRYIDQHVPHVAALLKEDCADVIRGAQTIVVERCSQTPWTRSSRWQRTISTSSTSPECAGGSSSPPNIRASAGSAPAAWFEHIPTSAQPDVRSSCPRARRTRACMKRRNTRKMESAP